MVKKNSLNEVVQSFLYKDLSEVGDEFWPAGFKREFQNHKRKVFLMELFARLVHFFEIYLAYISGYCFEIDVVTFKELSATQSEW